MRGEPGDLAGRGIQGSGDQEGARGANKEIWRSLIPKSSQGIQGIRREPGDPAGIKGSGKGARDQGIRGSRDQEGARGANREIRRSSRDPGGGQESGIRIPKSSQGI